MIFSLSSASLFNLAFLSASTFLFSSSYFLLISSFRLLSSSAFYLANSSSLSFLIFSSAARLAFNAFSYSSLNRWISSGSSKLTLGASPSCPYLASLSLFSIFLTISMFDRMSILSRAESIYNGLPPSRLCSLSILSSSDKSPA